MYDKATPTGIIRRPFDILVQFGHGARIFAQFGCAGAKTFAERSPIAISYRESRLARKVSVVDAVQDVAALQDRLQGDQVSLAVDRWRNTM